MRFGISTLLALSGACAAFAAADKKLPIEASSNEYVEIKASLLDKDQVQQELGSDLGGTIVVVRVRVRPVTDKPWKIDLDDFLLLDGNLGERAQPYEPSQIAGNTSLVVTPQGTRGGIGGRSGGPVFGVPGLGYPGGAGIGNSGGVVTENKTKIEDNGKKGDSPLLKVLKEKVLPENEITDPVTGLLYFQMEGKVKAKDLELYYKTPGGKLGLRFRP